MELLGEFKNYYKEIFYVDETNYSVIYNAFNQEKKYVCLKIIEKEKLKTGDYNFLLEQFIKEEEITKLCKSQYTINLYRKLENEKIILFELEYFEQDLKNYLSDYGKPSLELFKNIAL